MVINKVEVVIQGKDNLSPALTSATSRLSKMGKGIASLTARFGPLLGVAGIAGATTAVIAFTKATANAGDEFQKMALRTGVSTEALGGLKFAAEISGASIQTIEKGLKTVAKRLLDADSGLAEAKRSFERVGIAVKDASGNLKEADVVLVEFADKLGNLKTDTEKAALAQELFGKAGTQLLPFFKLGSKGIRELQEEAKKLGITFSDVAANQAAEFNDTILRLTSSFVGIRNTIFKEVIPVLEPLIKNFQEWVVASKDLIALNIKGFLSDLGTVLKVTAEAGKLFLAPIVEFIRISAALVEGTLKAVKALNEMFGAQDAEAAKKLDVFARAAKDAGLSVLEFGRATLSAAEIARVLAGDLDDELRAKVEVTRKAFAGLNADMKKFQTTIQAGKPEVDALTLAIEAARIESARAGDANLFLSEAYKEAFRAGEKAIRVQEGWEKSNVEATAAAARFKEELKKQASATFEAAEAAEAAARAAGEYEQAVNELIVVHQEGSPIMTAFWENLVGSKDGSEEDSLIGRTTLALGKVGAALQNAFSDAIFKTITGQFESLKDVGLNVAKAIAAAFADLVASEIFGAVRDFVREGSSFFGGLLRGAEGGLVTRPTAALLGEAGPEVVLPLALLAGVLERTAKGAIAAALPEGLKVFLAETTLRAIQSFGGEFGKQAIINAALRIGPEAALPSAAPAVLGDIFKSGAFSPGAIGASLAVTAAAQFGIARVSQTAADVLAPLGRIAVGAAFGGPVGAGIVAALEAINQLFKVFGFGFFQAGTPFVPQDMLAFVHKGEAVIPAGENPFGSGSGFGMSRIEVNFNGPVSIRSDDDIRRLTVGFGREIRRRSGTPIVVS